MNNIIGLTGLKGCGKSTVASIIKKMGYAEYSFAQPMKEALSAMTGLDYQIFDSQDTKELPLEQFDGVTPRQMMQTLGTEWGRQMIHPDLWLIIAKQRLSNLEYVVVSDIRFENEAALIREMGGVIIHIERQTDKNETSNHESEKGIAFKECDLCIVNDSDIESLEQKVVSLFPKRLIRVSAARQTPKDFELVEEAIAYASKTVIASKRTIDNCRQALLEGEPFAYAYGFAEVYFEFVS